MSFVDHLNPVTLKELRQLVRSRVVSGGLISYLFILLLSVTIALLSERDKFTGVAATNVKMGDTVFNVVYFILGALLLFAMPLYVSMRMATERSGEQLDLQFATTLHPRKLVSGKAMAGIILVLLFACVSLPYIALAYILRGLDVLQAVISVIMLVLFAIVAIYEALFLGALATTRLLRGLILLLLLWSHGSLYAMTMAFSIEVNRGSLFLLNSWSDAIEPLLYLTAIASLVLLFRGVTIALITPRSLNRATAVRVLIMLLMLLWGIIAALTTIHQRDSTPFTIWVMVCLSVLLFCSIISASGESSYSRRVLSSLPRRRWLSLPLMPFYPGAINGLFWVMLCGAALLAATALALKMMPASWQGTPHHLEALIPANFFVNCLAVVLCARAFWYYLFRKRYPPNRLWIVLLALVLLGTLLPYILSLGKESKVVRIWLFGNLANVFADDVLMTRKILLSGLLWFLLFLLANLPEIISAVRNFRPLKATPAVAEPSPSPPEGGGDNA